MLTSYRLPTSDAYDSSSVIDPTADYTNARLFTHIDDDNDDSDDNNTPALDPFSASFDTATNDSTVPGGKHSSRVSLLSATAASPCIR